MRLAALTPPGTKIAIGSRHFSAEDIIRFAERFDPQPFHIDAKAAENYIFGGLCASGWHTCANWMRSFVDYWSAETARLEMEGIQPPKLGPSPGFRDLQWLRPVFAGDTIRYSITLTASRALASRPGWLINTALSEGENQSGEPVIRFTSSILEFE